MAAYVNSKLILKSEFTRTYIANTSSGTIGLVNDVYGFNLVAIDVSVEGGEVFVYKCPIVTIDKKTGTGESISKGERVYGDPNDEYKVSATKGAGYVFLGWAEEDAAASDTTVVINYDGTLHEVF